MTFEDNVKAALDELTEISSQIESAVLFGADGEVVASTLPDLHAKQVAASAKALFEEAGRAATGELTHLEAITGDGSLFVVREGDLLVAAATGAEPTAGLVFYDLKACLRSRSRERRRSPSPERPGRRAMESRRLFAIGLAVGSLLGIGLYARRARGSSERIDLYFADGSLTSLDGGGSEAARLIARARDVLRAARP